ncbi:hypothetical protein Sjap_002988 [Stephania japonica]|uniref:Argonaute 4 n=1 Tax=Stephania japonica TaxID=461633 RepID=A0AAP0KPF0_9MAGN
MANDGMEEKGAIQVHSPTPSPSAKMSQETVECSKRAPIIREGYGQDGQHVSLLVNDFKVSVNALDGIFYQYNVSITNGDKQVVEGKDIGRKVMDKLYETYSSLIAGKHFAYDGEKSMYTVGPLPQNKLEFAVVLEGSYAKCDGSPGRANGKRTKHSSLAKTFNVEISYAAKFPMKSIALALQGNDVNKINDSLRVLDIILRQHAAKRGCLLVRQSFFHDDVRNFIDVGGGVSACRGFHSSFRTTQGGLSLNMDASSTIILTPGPVLNFLLANQNVRSPHQIDWGRAKKMLKSLIVKATHRNMEFKIIGLSENSCDEQFFTLKVKNGDGTSDEDQTIQITVYEYFTKHRNVHLTYSASMPCLDVGKPKRPNYLPLELCSLVSLQRYKKALSTMQRSSLVEKSRQKPRERIQIVMDAARNNRYEDDPMLKECGISIEKSLTQVDGRVLDAPTLKVGNNQDCIPCNGRWNFRNQRLLAPKKIQCWAVVNFSARCDTSYLCRELINSGRNKGIDIDRPYTIIDEDPQCMRSSPVMRVEKMFEMIRSKLPGPPDFLLCVLPERKNCDIYGPWKMKNLHEMGIVTQCISPVKINDQYLTNVLLKINSKLGGMNSLLAVEHVPSIPLIKETPTMILGMDVSHGSPGQSDVPSIAAVGHKVVGSRYWPLISRYRASVRTQSPKVEMIDSLYKLQADGEDGGIMRELLIDFYQTSQHRKPTQIIIFRTSVYQSIYGFACRDGVSESQFNQVLNIELEQIVKAFQQMGETWLPKFTVVVAQKNHHTKLFLANGSNNVPPGTVVDTKVVHPRNYDFYMCAQAGMIGTSRPIHYHVLLNEIGFSPDELQKLVHALSYVYQRSTSAVSLGKSCLLNAVTIKVAPICYAHLAAQQVSQFIKFGDSSDSSSGHGFTSAGDIIYPELPRLHENVRSSMFFC